MKPPINLNTFKANKEAEKAAKEIVDIAFFSGHEHVTDELSKILDRSNHIEYTPGGDDRSAIELKNPIKVSRYDAINPAISQTFNFDVDHKNNTFTLLFDDNYKYTVFLPEIYSDEEINNMAKDLEMEGLRNSLANEHSYLANAFRRMSDESPLPKDTPKNFLPHPFDTTPLEMLLDISEGVEHYRYYEDSIHSHPIEPQALLDEGQYQLWVLSPQPHNRLISVDLRESRDRVTIKLPESYLPEDVIELVNDFSTIIAENHQLMRDHDPFVRALMSRPMPKIELDPETEAWMKEKLEKPKPIEPGVDIPDNVSRPNFSRN